MLTKLKCIMLIDDNPPFGGGCTAVEHILTGCACHILEVGTTCPANSGSLQKYIRRRLYLSLPVPACPDGIYRECIISGASAERGYRNHIYF